MGPLGTEATGLVVHRDESAIQARGQPPALHPADGRPLSKIVTQPEAHEREAETLALEQARMKQEVIDQIRGGACA